MRGPAWRLGLRLLALCLLVHGVASQCPAGLTALNQNGQTVTCQPQSATSCSSISVGYFCQFSTQNNNFICCGLNSNACGASGSALVGPNGQAQSCQSNVQCGSGYSCTSGVCCAALTSGSCPQNWVLQGTTCLRPAAIGESCTLTQQCQAVNAQCTNAYCTCAQGLVNVAGQCVMNSGLSCTMYQVAVNGQCMSLVGQGSQCSSGQCMGALVCQSSFCQCPSTATLNSGYCTATPVCANGMVLVNNKCYTAVQIGGTCTMNEQCTSGSCQNGICQSGGGGTGTTCNLGMTSINGQCVQLSPPGSQCSTGNNLQCLGNSLCNFGTCQCLSNSTQYNGYCVAFNTGGSPCSSNQVYINGQCYALTSPGGFCQQAQQCLGSSFCSGGTCQCQSGTTLYNGYCLTSSNSNNGNCQTNQVSINGFCYNTVQLGGQCNFNQQCPANSQCTNGLCQCNSGYQNFNGVCSVGSGGTTCQLGMVNVNGNCVQVSQPGGSCSSGSTLQCVGGASCNFGQCTCLTNSTQYSGYCIPLNTGTPCQTNQIYLNGQCLYLAPPSGSCQTNQQCLGSSYCTNGLCQCQTGWSNYYGYCLSTTSSNTQCTGNQVIVNGQCLQMVLNGVNCQASQQCLSGGYCSNGICQGGFCSNTNQVYVNNQCWNSAQQGGSCQYTQQCLNGGTCSGGICQSSGNNNNFCQGNQVQINGQCYNTVQLGGYCQYTQQCPSNAQCSNAYCQCNSGYTNVNGYCNSQGGTGGCQSYQISSNGMCLDTVSIGQSCQVQQQCIPNSFCTSGLCQCATGYLYTGSACVSSSTSCPHSTVSASGTCLQLAQLGQFCSTNVQCMGFAVCTSSVCQCPYAYTQINGVCRQNTNNNGNCQSNQVYVNGQCLSQVQLGGYCQVTQQCTGNGQCQNGVCQCAQGSYNNNGVCSTSSSTQCSSTGWTPVLQNNQPINCMLSYCPSNAQCQFSSTTQQYICCQQSTTTNPGTSLTCSQSGYVVATQNGQPINCLYQYCPSNNVCQFNSQAQQYVCCGPNSG